MTNVNPEAGSSQTPSQFEKDNKLVPFGDNFEARAIRAEAILDTVLPKLLSISVVVPRTAARDVKDLQSTTQEVLNRYRDEATVKADQAWKDAYPETEAYD